MAPFEIDALYDLMLLDTFFDNPVVITVVIIIWVIYMFLVLWAMNADRRDREKVSFCDLTLSIFMPPPLKVAVCCSLTLKIVVQQT